MKAGTSWRFLALCAAPTLMLFTRCGGKDGGSSNDAGADKDPGPVLRPDEIFGDDLAWWLDADDVTTCVFDDIGYVREWHNKVDTRYYVIGHGVGSGITRGQVAPNMHYALRVGPANGALGDESFGCCSASLVAVVVAYANAPGVEGELSNFFANSKGMSDTEKTKIWVSAGVGAWLGSVDAGWNDGKFHAYGERLSAGMYSLRTDGIVSSTPSTDMTFGIGLELGGGWRDIDGGPVVDRALDGYIAELVAVSGVRSGVGVIDSATDDRVFQLSRYFQQKYGIPF